MRLRQPVFMWPQWPLIALGLVIICDSGCVRRNKDLGVCAATNRSDPAEPLRNYLKLVNQSDKVSPRDRHKVPMRAWGEFYGMNDAPENTDIEMLVLAETLNGRALHRSVREKFGKHIAANHIHAPILTDRAIAEAIEHLQPQRVRVEHDDEVPVATRIHFDMVNTSDSTVPLQFHMLDGPVVIIWNRQLWQIYPRATFGMRGTIKDADVAKPLGQNPSLAAKRILQHRRMSGVIAALREDEIKSLEELNARLDEIFAPQESKDSPSATTARSDDK